MTTKATPTAAQTAKQYNRGWNDAVGEFKHRRAEANEIADMIFCEEIGNAELFGHLSEMPPPAYRRGWKDAVWQMSLEDYVGRR